MNKESFIIQGLGEKRISGTISVNGAKNDVLIIMAASLLCDDVVTITNVPKIADVYRASEILEDLGAIVSWKDEQTITIDPSSVTSHTVSPDVAGKLRASIVFTGSLLGRMSKVEFPHPGGCVLGKRPIDFFKAGYEAQGAEFTDGEKFYVVERKERIDSEYFFPMISVTGTESMVMAASVGAGTTVLHNCALEPEIKSVADFLNACGANIKGAGTPTITITGSGKLLRSDGHVHYTLPDRIETASFLIMGALVADDLEITNCIPGSILAVTTALQSAGVNIEIGENYLRVNAKNRANYQALDIKTKEFPGFPTDAQSPMTVFLTQCQGESLVFETIYEGRLNYVTGLEKMGATIRLMDAHRALIKGPEKLRGRELDGPDIRTGFAFDIAALVAEGESQINNIYYIDRGYAQVEKRLNAVGVSIERVGEKV